ncbi:hypothetical protein H4217_005266 [Coemansia sp. RSA 1939]|nr:hypothetical protein H4217_005266 [Coemansia sp. RSA 1939]KAJ2608407.1 hypothetical protein EV177_004992 [Coemansia sp. RSA 1804]KAJ2693079.1 hypothetical protein GGH99_001340 [Coemansia sp. RSA 1285]
MSDAQTQQVSSLALRHCSPQQQQNIDTARSSTVISGNGPVSLADVTASTAASAQESAASEKKDDKSVPVRKRLSLACTTCRQRKVKCDGGRPACRTCAKFNWPCIYQPSNRKRGPRPRALALMDGPMPYSTRSHWSIPHAYYPPYAIPGRSPMSPPPPPSQLLVSHFGASHHPDVPQNGASLRIDPAYQHPGGYNYDTYSSYGDYMATTGAIRIRPPPPPSASSSQYAHAPGVYPPMPGAARHGGYGGVPNVHPYARGYQHPPSAGYETAHGMPPPSQSRFSPHGASGSMPFGRPFPNGGAPDCRIPNTAPLQPPSHYSTHSQPPHSLSPTARFGSTAGDPWRPSGHPGDAKKYEPGLSTGVGQSGAMHEQASPMASPTTGQPSGPGVSPPANSATLHPSAAQNPRADVAAASATAATPLLGSPAPQQRKRVLAQQYVSAASPYASEMQPPIAGAGAHSLAMYARRKADTAAHADNGSNSTMAGSASSMIDAVATSGASYSTDSRNGDSRMVLSSPPQPSTTTQNGTLATTTGHGYSSSLVTPMSVPIASAASFAKPAYNSQHPSHHTSNVGYVSPGNASTGRSPRELSSHHAHIPAGAPVSPTMISKPLPFTSNGTLRPRLPPLSEVLGKDYRMVMSPSSNNNNNNDNGGSAQNVADKHPMSSSIPLSATPMDHYSQPGLRRRDSFRD